MTTALRNDTLPGAAAPSGGGDAARGHSAGRSERVHTPYGRLTPEELEAYASRRGYRAARVEGNSCFELLGPRRNRTVLVPDSKGGFSLAAASLWCDGVDYATMAVERRRARRGQRNAGAGS